MGGILLLGLGLPGSAGAQIISPGRLSQAHGQLEGMGKCTQCHQLRTAGADRSRCLHCHESLGRRLETGEGFHGKLQEKECGACHKEHLGEDFALIRMEPDTFSHASAGYVLEGAHQQAECRTCHNPELVTDPELRAELSEGDGLTRTYLGLDRRCGSCHEADNPHRNQFPEKDCSVCHAEVEWESAPAFVHDRTAYPLDGEHRDAECSGCHVVEQPGGESGSIRYAPLDAADCVSCHEDPHENRMPGRCRVCHTTTGWSRVDRSTVESTFDHEVTEYSLFGAHAEAECRTCHSPALRGQGELRLRFPSGTAGHSYPKPEHDTCTSCHLDFHEGVFQERGCDLCHGFDSWDSPDYDRAQHQMEFRFELSGSHAVTPCSACHETESGGERRFVFRFEDPNSCNQCHQDDDPHEETFMTPKCDLCHETSGFVPDQFDHALLEQAGWVGGCRACHEDDDPHGGQFRGKDCRECHGTDAYAISDFDHMATRYPLGGAHGRVPCGECHLAVEGPSGPGMIRYRPMDQSCTACHGGGG